MTVALCYMRFSDPVQAGGDSTERQVEEITARAHELGHADLIWYKDEGISSFRGAHRTKGSLGQLLDDLEAGTYPKGVPVIIDDVSRFSREEGWNAVMSVGRIVGAGSLLYDASQPLESSVYGQSHADLDAFNRFQSAAHLEVVRKSRNVSKAWKHKRERAVSEGEPLTRRTRYGYRVEGTGTDRKKCAGCTYVIKEDEAALVRRAFELIADGMSPRAVARLYTSEGHKPPKGGKAWGKSTIWKWVQLDDVYLGKLRPHVMKDGKRVASGEVVEIPAIVTPELAAAARAAIPDPTSESSTHRSSAGNLLTGKAFCSCGASLQKVNKGKRSPIPKLVCSHLNRGLIVKGDHARVLLESVEWTVLRSLRDQIEATVDKVMPAKSDRSTDAARNRLEEEVSLTRRQVDKLDAVILEAPPGPSRTAYIAKADAARQELSELEGRLREIDDAQAREQVRQASRVRQVRSAASLINAVLTGRAMVDGQVLKDPTDIMAGFDAAGIEAAASVDVDALRIKLKGVLANVLDKVVVDGDEVTVYVHGADPVVAMIGKATKGYGWQLGGVYELVGDKIVLVESESPDTSATVIVA